MPQSRKCPKFVPCIQQQPEVNTLLLVRDDSETWRTFLAPFNLCVNPWIDIEVVSGGQNRYHHIRLTTCLQAPAEETRLDKADKKKGSEKLSTKHVVLTFSTALHTFPGNNNHFIAFHWPKARVCISMFHTMVLFSSDAISRMNWRFLTDNGIINGSFLVLTWVISCRYYGDLCTCFLTFVILTCMCSFFELCEALCLLKKLTIMSVVMGQTNQSDWSNQATAVTFLMFCLFLCSAFSVLSLSVIICISGSWKKQISGLNSSTVHWELGNMLQTGANYKACKLTQVS